MDKRNTSLPLLEWEPPRKLLPFPLIRRVGKIRRCAEVLEGKSGTDADGYLRQQLRMLSQQLGRSGCTMEEIDRQLSEFADAIQWELIRRSYEGESNGRHNPGDSA